MVYKNFLTIKDLDLKGKVVFLIVDINSEIINGKPTISSRIKEHSKTISLLKKRRAKVIVTSFQSRPGKKDFISLRGHSRLINKLTKIKFIEEFVGDKSEDAIKNLKEGEAILLENRRFEPSERNPTKKNKVLEFFKDKFDIYINDAFSVCHRNETSITLLPKNKKRAIGPVLERELKNANKIKEGSKDSLFILGGIKIEDIILLIDKNRILPAGTLALLVLKAKGYDLGKKEVKRLKPYFKYLPRIKKHLNLFEIPLDMAYEINKKRNSIEVQDFPVNEVSYDIGDKTIKKYEGIISKTKRIYMKGTPGNCELKDFCKGTIKIFHALEKNKGFCVISGGHSVTAMEKYKINKNKIGYVSLSGGALVYFIAGKKLPGLKALEKNG